MIEEAARVYGKGPSLLKVGNWLSHLEFDLTSPVWGHLLEALSSRHTLLRYDQRGTGLSDREVEHMSFDDWLRDFMTDAKKNNVTDISAVLSQ